MQPPGRSRYVVIALVVAFVFLGIEAVEALSAADALPAPLRFAALHTVGVLVFGVLSVLAVLAAILLSRRLRVAVIGVALAAAAVALVFV